jgi:hypothetical protein
MSNLIQITVDGLDNGVKKFHVHKECYPMFESHGASQRAIEVFMRMSLNSNQHDEVFGSRYAVKEQPKEDAVYKSNGPIVATTKSGKTLIQQDGKWVEKKDTVEEEIKNPAIVSSSMSDEEMAKRKAAVERARQLYNTEGYIPPIIHVTKDDIAKEHSDKKPVAVVKRNLPKTGLIKSGQQTSNNLETCVVQDVVKTTEKYKRTEMFGYSENVPVRPYVILPTCAFDALVISTRSIPLEVIPDIHRLLYINASRNVIARRYNISYQNVYHYWRSFKHFQRRFEVDKSIDVESVLDKYRDKINSMIQEFTKICDWTIEDMTEKYGIDEYTFKTIWFNLPWFADNV